MDREDVKDLAIHLAKECKDPLFSIIVFGPLITLAVATYQFGMWKFWELLELSFWMGVVFLLIGLWLWLFSQPPPCSHAPNCTCEHDDS